MKKSSKFIASLFLTTWLSAVAAWGQGQGQVDGLNYAMPDTFQTIAGSVANAGNADGANANASFYFPQGMAADTNGNVYLVDSAENTVRKLSAAGTNWNVVTIAGTAGAAGAGDGTGSGARFNEPMGIARDQSGNLYIADFNNSTIRKLALAGGSWVSSTLAGTAGNYGSSDGTNGAAAFEYPGGVAVDTSSNLYVADTVNNAIRKISPSGTNWVVTTIAGTPGIFNMGSSDGTNGDAGFFEPNSVAVDAATNIFVADGGNFTVREISPVGTNWVTTTIAGQAGQSGNADGTNGAALFSDIYGLTLDAQDNIYVVDTYNNLVRKLSPVGTNWVTTTLGGLVTLASGGSSDGTGTNATFYQPSGIVVDGAGNLFVSDTGNHIVRRGFFQALSVPNLAIGAAGNSVQVMWPAVGGTLQTNGDLSMPNWAAYGGTPTVSNGTNIVVMPGTNRAMFFRLSQ